MLHKRKLLLLAIDTGCFLASYLAVAVMASLSDSGYVFKSVSKWIVHALVVLLLAMALRMALRVYNNMWRYANSKAYLKMVASDGISAFVSVIVTRTVFERLNIGIWQTIIVFMGFCLLTLVNRFIYQWIKGREISKRVKDKKNIAIVGAGSVGVLLAEELIANKKSPYVPYCFIDNDETKISKTVNGIKVYAEDDKIIERIKRMPVSEIILAIPSLNGEEARRLLDFYSKTGCKVKIYAAPITSDDISGGDKKTLRDIKIEDLLFRDSLVINNAETKSFYKDKVIMVTGGGGSIGSELCRQIAKCSPKRLIIVDIYENNAYDIQQELMRKYGDKLDLCVEIASVRETKRMDAVFSNYRPEVVFHAAAHKHVPLMEHSNCEAIKNNVLGTYKTANMAEKYGVERFILVSTDKAVNPTNIMGASKRMCEMVIQCRTDSATSFAAVRFGNVLGSNGSVIPLFKRQIENGGPITITDKRIIRYFMTIPEASQLVMEAGAIAKRGELFVLDMGKPIKILELAENMVRLSGYEPYEDIDIVETGLRPGEKLYEELLMKSEELVKTHNKLIFIEKDKPLSRAEVEEKIEMLKNAVEEAKDELCSDLIKKAMKKAVPTYHDPEEVNKDAGSSKEMAMA